MFGADYSGHRYTQPVFNDLEPHHFKMGYHEETGEGLLVINPESLLINQQDELYPFVIKNIGTADVTISAIFWTSTGDLDLGVPSGIVEIHLDEFSSLELPATLSPNEELEVNVYFAQDMCKCRSGEIVREEYISIINDSENDNIQYPVILDYTPSGIGETNNCITIYPNPVTDFINVKGNGTAEVKVYDLTGRLVKQAVKESDELSISMKDCESGVYIIQVVSKESSSTQRIVKR